MVFSKEIFSYKTFFSTRFVVNDMKIEVFFSCSNCFLLRMRTKPNVVFRTQFFSLFCLNVAHALTIMLLARNWMPQVNLKSSEKKTILLKIIFAMNCGTKNKDSHGVVEKRE